MQLHTAFRTKILKLGGVNENSKSESIVLRFKRIGKLKWKINWNELGSNFHHSDSEQEFLKSMNEFLEDIIIDDPTDYFFFQDRYKGNN